MAADEPPGLLRRLCDGPWMRYTLSITDDAFVQTHVVNVAPQEVSGHLVRYPVQENDLKPTGRDRRRQP
jgi:hypothetical protein